MSEKYPKSGLYREHKAEVQGHAEERYELFVANLDKHLRLMFGGGLDTTKVTPEERADICLIARYALKRLATGAVYSKFHHTPGTLPDAVNHIIRQGDVGHDIVHAILAGIMSDQMSHIPAYAKEPHGGMSQDKKLQSQAILEEAYVELFASPQYFAQDFREAFEDPKQLDRRLKYAGVPFLERHKMRELAKTNPRSFCVEYWEKRGSIGGNPTQRAYRTAHRSPIMATYIGNLYEQSKNGALEPKFALTQFLRINEPLLTRLRAKPNASE